MNTVLDERTDFGSSVDGLQRALEYALKCYPQVPKNSQTIAESQLGGVLGLPDLVLHERIMSTAWKEPEPVNVCEVNFLWNRGSTQHISHPYVEWFSKLQKQIENAPEPKIVVDALKMAGPSEEYAKRLTDLYTMVNEEGETIVLQSLRRFALFILRVQSPVLDAERNSYDLMQKNWQLPNYRSLVSFTMHEQLPTPEIGINADGFIQSVWKIPGYGSLAMDFLPSDDVAFSILFYRDAYDGQQQRVSGVVPQPNITHYIEEFINRHNMSTEYLVNMGFTAFWRHKNNMASEQPFDIINTLKENRRSDIAERLADLYAMANEEDETIVVQSLQQFATFAIREQLPVPEFGVNADGFIQSVWKIPGYGSLAMDFLPSDDVAFSILFYRDAYDGQQQRVSGVVSQSSIMYYIREFASRLAVC